MAVCPDEATLKEVNEKLRQLLEGKHTPPVVNVIAITEEEFGRTAPLAQSQVGQAARHGITPDSKGLDYRPERDPEPETVRPRSRFLAHPRCDPPRGILRHGEDVAGRWFPHPRSRGPDGAGARLQGTAHRRQRRNPAPQGRDTDVAAYGKHCALTDQEGTFAMESLLATTRKPDGTRCTLTKFTEAWRRGEIVPDPTKSEWQALTLYLAPAVNALIDEALVRSGGTREDIREERNRRGDLRAKAEPGTEMETGLPSAGGRRP